jgi:hypothetical protein
MSIAKPAIVWLLLDGPTSVLISLIGLGGQHAPVQPIIQGGASA